MTTGPNGGTLEGRAVNHGSAGLGLVHPNLPSTPVENRWRSVAWVHSMAWAQQLCLTMTHREVACLRSLAADLGSKSAAVSWLIETHESALDSLQIDPVSGGREDPLMLAPQTKKRQVPVGKDTRMNVRLQGDSESSERLRRISDSCNVSVSKVLSALIQAEVARRKSLK